MKKLTFLVILLTLLAITTAAFAQQEPPSAPTTIAGWGEHGVCCEEGSMMPVCGTVFLALGAVGFALKKG